jgi:hypothetical protein
MTILKNILMLYNSHPHRFCFTQSTHFGLLLRFAGAIVTKGEFIVVFYRLMLYDFSNDWHITRRECLFVVAVVAATAAMLAAVVVAWHSRGFRVVVVGCCRCRCCCRICTDCYGGFDCGLLRRRRLPLGVDCGLLRRQ